MRSIRVFSISTLFPSEVWPQHGAFVANQMTAVARLPGIDLTMVHLIGVHPWPLSLRKPHRDLKRIGESSDLDGLRVHNRQFTSIPIIGGWSNPRRVAAAVLPLARQLHAEEPFDLVDAQFFFPDGPAAATIARELDLPFSIKARGGDIHYWGDRAHSRRQLVAAAQQAAGMLAVSEALRQDMIALGMPAERISVHYTGLDRDRFRPIDRTAARAGLTRLPPDGPLLVCTGSLIERKGQGLVIEALAAVPDARLALAGTGKDEARLRALATRLGVAERVHFLGQVSHGELPQLLAAADAMVLPSASEGLANAWIEALACGCPLVISEAGGAREVVTRPEAGRIVARDAEAITAAVRELLADPPPREMVAECAARFSWEANAAALAGYYRKLVT